jgi:D-glycero-alpha-D-manno-heptose 1-phosphate guanylyltransferase
MQAIILVGGFGTRLRTLLPDVPKPMAPIDDKPFLAHLLLYLKTQGITSIIFSVHYQREQIQHYFQSHYAGMDIAYAEEDEPLGTGGAIVNSLSLLLKTNEPVFVLNGDTFVKLDYQAMVTQHLQHHSPFTMALRSVADCSRYGNVVIENNRVIEFKEKGGSGPGFINAGIYLMHPTLFSPFTLPKQFSIEKDFLYLHVQMLKPHAFVSHDYFIDIGIPEDYERAKNELPAFTV